MNRKNLLAFTLIELIVFIMISGLIMKVITMGATTSLANTPNIHNLWVAQQTARECMEWFLSQRQLNGYSVITCPSTPTVSNCTAPTGFTVTNSVVCTTWNSDTTYKTITVTVGGLAAASVSYQIGKY